MNLSLCRGYELVGVLFCTPFPPFLFDDVKGGEAASRTICMFPFSVVCLRAYVALHVGMHCCLSSSTSDVCPCNLLKIYMNIEISTIPTLAFFVWFA